MGAYYGHKWTSSMADTFGEAGPAGQIWAQALAAYTPHEIGAALLALTDREDDWPPSIREFRLLCRPPIIDTGDAWKSAKPDPARMPSPERVAWHKANIAHLEAGGELPRTDDDGVPVHEPEAP